MKKPRYGKNKMKRLARECKARMAWLDRVVQDATNMAARDGRSLHDPSSLVLYGVQILQTPKTPDIFKEFFNIDV